MTEMNLEIYARILARLACRRGARLDEILAELGVDADAFGHAEPGLRAELSGAWPNRKGIGAMKFATALGTELERLGALGNDTHPSKVVGDDGPPALFPAAPRPREPEVPSFLQAAAAPQVSIARMAPPPEPAPPPPVIHVPPAEPSSGASLAGTANMDVHAFMEAAKRGESALPFAPSEEVPSIAAEPSVRPTVALPSRPRLSGTIDADLSAVVASVKRGALPFGALPEPSPPSVAASGSDFDFARFSLEVYASVTGALARGEPRDAVLVRHSMSPEAYDRMAKAWAQRFQREPHLLAWFQELARNSAAAPRPSE